MVSKISTQITEYALSHEIIRSEEYNIYHFAFLSLIERVISWGCIILVGCLSGLFFGTFSFLCTFIPLRSYAGGFHAREYRSCFISSTVSFFLMILIYQNILISASLGIQLSLLLVAYITIWKLAPLEDKNKPLNATEYIKYKRNARIILNIEFMATVTMLLLNTQRQITSFIVMGIVMESILLLLSPKK